MKHKIVLSIILACFLVACGGEGRNKRGSAETTDTSVMDTVSAIDPVVNVYIENSGSMDGYVNGNTEFKGAIRDLLVLLKHHYKPEKIKVHFINNKVRETDTQQDLATFSQNINTYWKVQGEDRGSSNLNNVFKMILDKTNKETISILFSDCIYSIKGKNAEGLLSDEKSLTKDAFLSRWRVDSLKLATTIVKMNSKFSGIYYDKDDRKTELKGDLRPYYISVIGNNDVMLDFNNKIPLEKGKIEGFDNKYIISTGDTSPYYSVLLSTDNVGRFKSTREASTSNYIHGIEKVKLDTRNHENLSFALAVDFKDIEAEEDYWLNPENYTTSNNNFKVKEVKRIDEKDMHASDWNRISSAKPTHIIVLQATGTALSNITLSLKKQMPQWIQQTNIIDDSNIKANLDKTFGIQYLIEGIAESYQIIYPEDKNHFELSISIKP